MSNHFVLRYPDRHFVSIKLSGGRTLWINQVTARGNSVRVTDEDAEKYEKAVEQDPEAMWERGDRHPNNTRCIYWKVKNGREPR